jgi:hypothetical protein
VALQSPIEGYGLEKGIDPHNDTNLGGGVTATALQSAQSIRPGRAMPFRADGRSRFLRTMKRVHR